MPPFAFPGRTRRRPGWLLGRPRRGDGVQLIGVVEHRGLGRARRAGVVVDRDRVQQLRADVRLERGCALFDQP